MLRFEDPTWLSALWLLLLIPAIGWFSTALRARRWRVASACIRTIIVAAVIVALARPIREHAKQQRSPVVVIALQDISESAAAHRLEAGATRKLWSRYQSALPDDVESRIVAFAGGVAPLDESAAIDSGETNVEAAIDRIRKAFAG